MVAISQIERTSNGDLAGSKLHGLGRCPYCSIASPNLNRVWSDNWHSTFQAGWAGYRCNTCGSVVIAKLKANGGDRLTVITMWPAAKEAHEDIPNPARGFLQQAFETLHAPDAAAVMAGSAVDAMLKELGYNDGSSLYVRIDKALADGHLTKGMAEWAHSVRLGSNRPRHADAERPHVSADEAKQSVDFAEALGNFLFVLTARIKRGIEAAEAADKAE